MFVNIDIYFSQIHVINKFSIPLSRTILNSLFKMFEFWMILEIYTVEIAHSKK